MADVSLTQLLPGSRAGILFLLDKLGWGDEPSGEQLAWVVLLLRKAPDKVSFFPHGKHATIQQLEFLLDRAADSAINAANLESCL